MDIKKISSLLLIYFNWKIIWVLKEMEDSPFFWRLWVSREKSEGWFLSYNLLHLFLKLTCLKTSQSQNQILQVIKFFKTSDPIP